MHETVAAGFKKPHLSPAERADDLVRRMTLEEKSEIVVGASSRDEDCATTILNITD